MVFAMQGLTCGAHTGELLATMRGLRATDLWHRRFASPLGVYDFQKRTSVVQMSADGAVIV